MADEKEIHLNEDQQELAQRAIRDLRFGVSALSKGIKESEGLDSQLAFNVLRCCDHNLSALGEVLGIPTQTGQEIEERYARLREANERIHYLEGQLGTSQAPAATQASLKHMCEQIRAWWELEGFGHVSSIRFGDDGCEVDFCCSLFGYSSSFSKTPASDRQQRKLWRESLVERGFVLTGVDRDASPIDSDHNREILSLLFVSRLPSSVIMSFENQCSDKKSLMRGVKVFIRSIEEIHSLPIPEPDLPHGEEPL
ncbi:hypothetical protein [Uliginosibacterium gangwonense]|uniref:hypothetical protein n=1 Tax=Uliginosibacterium gangwonense TaxID=392736 RepID=UPI000360035D|nr:hypothetical protein [Uliginosibacterium gangwonense]